MATPAIRTLSRTPARAVALGLVLSLLVAACAPAAAPAPASAPAAAPAPRLPAAAPAPPPATEQPHYGGTLTVTSVADPANLDPQQEGSLNASMVVAPAYNNLLYYDFKEGKRITPELAERWDVSPDGLTYTFKLRSGVKFHDGTPLTVDDVVFNIQRLKSPPKGVPSTLDFALVAVDKIEAAGADTIKITMKYPFAPLASYVAIDRMPMYSRAYVEKQGDMKRTVMGTGPFKFKSYSPGVSVELVKNDDYWVKGRPYLNGVTFFIIKDKATRLAALRTGQAKQTGRVFAALTPTEAATLKKDVPAMRFIPSPTVLGPSFFMNLRTPPFKDQRVRQAMYLMVDRQAAVKVIAEGEGQVGNFFPFEGWGIPRDELVKLPGYRQPKDQDIAAAKKLLAEAGYPNGFPLKLLSRNNEVTKAAAVFMTDQLAKVGITASVQIIEDAPFWDSGRKAQYEAMVYTPATIADPHDMGRTFAARSYLNFSGNDDDPKMNEMWDKQMRSVDEKTRKAAIVELERYLLMEQIPSVPIVWPTTFIAVAPQVQGFVAGMTDYANNRHQETWLIP